MNPNLYRRPPGKRHVTRTPRERLDVSAFRENLTTAPAPVVVDRSTDCFVTPPGVAARMVEFLDPSPGERILEPSAGTGNLVAALLETGHEPWNVVAVELALSLADALRGRLDGVKVHPANFLDWAGGTLERFDGVLMNPPFSKRRAPKHVDAALSLLKDGGRLVALVPCTFDHPEAETVADLPPGTFAGTDVRTKIILIER